MVPIRATAAAILLLLAAACNGTPELTPEPSPTPTAVPADSVQELSGEPDGSARCGDYSLEWRSPELGAEGPPATLTAREGAVVVLSVEGGDEFEQLLPLWCGDLTGDGRPELGLEIFTGGAHCCFTLRVDTLDGPTLLDRDLGNAGGPEPDRLDEEGALEIVTQSDVLAYFDLPFAASPFLPLVFAYDDGRYVEATPDYPGHVRQGLEGASTRLEEALGQYEEFPEAARGAALGVFGHYVLLGEASEGLEEIATRAPEDVTEWVRERADRAASAIRSGRPEGEDR